MGEMDILKRDLAASFARIKEDMQKKDEQIKFALNENRKLQEKISALERRKPAKTTSRQELETIAALDEKIKRLESAKTAKNDSTELMEKIMMLERQQDDIKKAVKEAVREAVPQAARKPGGIAVKVTRNKKTIIKNQILNTIQEKELTIPELKEIIVDEQRFCSKATFYRYIEKLKHCYDCAKVGERDILMIKKQELIR